MQGLIAYLFGLWNGTKQLVGNIISWTVSYITHLVDAIFAMLLTILPQSWKDYWDAFQTQLENVYEFLDVISYFVPIYAMLAFILGVYSAVASIRLARWMLALIPRAFTGVS